VVFERESERRTSREGSRVSEGGVCEGEVGKGDKQQKNETTTTKQEEEIPTYHTPHTLEQQQQSKRERERETELREVERTQNTKRSTQVAEKKANEDEKNTQKKRGERTISSPPFAHTQHTHKHAYRSCPEKEVC
jgi:hypothetical protein